MDQHLPAEVILRITRCQRAARRWRHRRWAWYRAMWPPLPVGDRVRSQRLLEHRYGTPSIEQSPHHGYSKAHMAVLYGNPAILYEAMVHGGNPFQRNVHGNSVLDLWRTNKCLAPSWAHEQMRTMLTRAATYWRAAQAIQNAWRTVATPGALKGRALGQVLQRIPSLTRLPSAVLLHHVVPAVTAEWTLPRVRRLPPNGSLVLT